MDARIIKKQNIYFERSLHFAVKFFSENVKKIINKCCKSGYKVVKVYGFKSFFLSTILEEEIKGTVRDFVAALYLTEKKKPNA